jgi:hypothetical protein
MTVEGEIAAFGEMARGAARAGGKLGIIGKAVIGLAVLGFAASFVFGLVNLFRG